MASATFDIAKLISSRPGLHGGRPCLAGTGITVHSVATAHREGLSVGEILERLPLDAAHVHAALAFYFANQASIDADLKADDVLYRELAAKYAEDVRGRPF